MILLNFRASYLNFCVLNFPIQKRSAQKVFEYSQIPNIPKFIWKWPNTRSWFPVKKLGKIRVTKNNFSLSSASESRQLRVIQGNSGNSETKVNPMSFLPAAADIPGHLWSTPNMEPIFLISNAFLWQNKLSALRGQPKNRSTVR
jgi:hypothetical protein